VCIVCVSYVLCDKNTNHPDYGSVTALLYLHFRYMICVTRCVGGPKVHNMFLFFWETVYNYAFGCFGGRVVLREMRLL